MHLYLVCILNHVMHFDFFSRKKFKCPVCGEGFKSDSEMQGHRKTEHDMKGP